jgi:hypothetical protein
MSSHRLAVRPLAVALAALALTSPTAMAVPISSLSEEQVLASRGTGAPTTAPVNSAASRGFGGARDALAGQGEATPVNSPYARGFGGARDVLAKQGGATTAADPGFDWRALALGAAGAAALIALIAFGIPALGARVRVRTAR